MAINLTREGYEKLEAELKYLKSTNISKIIADYKTLQL